MKLSLVAKTERQNTYCLRFVVPATEPRYQITPNGNDRSIEFTFKKDGVFGESSADSAAADNAQWFNGLVVGGDWELKRETELKFGA